jgi:hypothetical protein
MHFDQRTQAALRDAGFDDAEIRAASDAVAAAVERDADRLREFFDRDVVYSDMELAHSAGGINEHAVEYLDVFTHGSDLRGYLRFETWGVPIEGGRVLSDDVVELSLGPTVHDRVRFAADEDVLR